jgi:hypothetical protein
MRGIWLEITYICRAIVTYECNRIKGITARSKQYIDHADERVIRTMYAMLETGSEADWYDQMPDEINTQLEESIQQADRERL